jgi:hypothetical protein
MLAFIHKGKQRWYTISLHRDMFGELVITRTWGSLHSAQGGTASDPVASSNVRQALREAVKLRTRHKYSRVNPCPHLRKSAFNEVRK